MKFTLPNNVSEKVPWEYRAAFFAVLFQSLLCFAVLAINWSSLPPKIPLWLSRPWGEERLAYPLFLGLLPISAIAVYGANDRLSRKFGQNHPLFARVLSLTSGLVSLLSAVTVVRIVTLIR